MSECTSSAGHFDGHGGVPVQYEVHRLMQHVQSYTRSHWTLPLGNYSIRIIPAPTRATANKTTTLKYTYFLGHFDGHGNAPVRYRVHCLIKEVQGFTRRHWLPPSGKYLL
jgi:hypothetical protein